MGSGRWVWLVGGIAVAIGSGCGRPALPGGGGPGRGGSSGADARVDLPVATCGTVDHAARGVLPDILLLLDASGSLNDDLRNLSCANDGCGPTSKWAVLTPAVNQVVAQSEAHVNWGLKLFASDNACGVDAAAEIPIGTDNASAIAAAIAARTSANGGVANGSRTPTRSALERATAYLSAVPDTNRKFILLATDGLPNCPATGNSSNADITGAVAAAAAAAAAGVPVFVVGVATEGTISNGVDVGAVLGQIAVAGGRPRAGTPKYYPAASAGELASTLSMLVTAAGGCVLQIGTPPPSAGSPAVTAVTTSGVRREVASDPSRSDGWDYTDDTLVAIEIFGPTCDAIKAGSIQTLTVTFSCIHG